ncbi:MAG: helix-turn-helix transcriptional regulator [Deltaproteobacteria bacterium]|nr:helix-turn-helix transcriptional regulator [Deltaproteobacteria bacterium]
MNLGVLIRKCRKERKLTLKSVAEKAGISEGFLSQVENAVSSPSVETLIHICNAIGVQAGDLLNQFKDLERLVLIRRSEWDEMEVPRSGFVTRRFFPPEGRSVIDSAILLLEPDASLPVRKGVKNSQELLCVLKGSIEFVYGDQTFQLGQGDAVHFMSQPDHQNITNKSREPAIALWIGTL